jgi:GTP pyrophosphokinase
MRTLDAVELVKRRRIARETLEIYAPIANRLGLNSIYQELEDLAFSIYIPIATACSRKRSERHAETVAKSYRRCRTRSRAS